MNYIPDSVYMVCGAAPEDCNVCSNEVYSPVVQGMVHDPYNARVFCPFGMGQGLNQSITYDQSAVNTQNLMKNSAYGSTTWGKAPQLDPRPLSKIGLEWRTS
jgi:hypothetical protein